MRLHGSMTVLVLAAGFFLHVPALEVLFLLSAIAFVVVTEMVNTGIETAVDLITDEYNEQARIAKNVAAGAVLTASLYALVVGYLVLGQRVLRMLAG
jgi:diacylglycerol kinase